VRSSEIASWLRDILVGFGKNDSATWLGGLVEFCCRLAGKRSRAYGSRGRQPEPWRQGEPEGCGCICRQHTCVNLFIAFLLSRMAFLQASALASRNLVRPQTLPGASPNRGRVAGIATQVLQERSRLCTCRTLERYRNRAYQLMRYDHDRNVL
jgi:hypothetical protein